ncbi:MAG: transcriptional regulator [Fibrobacteres bacterium]|nr:transcriptional regulator [Fibrobacterota bacterium]
MPKINKNAESVRVERAIEIIKRLTTPRESATITELADEFHVDKRTIHRDISYLESLGFKTELIMGKKSKFKPFRFSSESPLAVPFGFTEDELLALLLAKTLFSSLKGTHLADAADSAAEKIAGFFPDEKVEVLQNAINVISGPLRNYKEHKDIIRLLLNSILETRCVKIGYDSRSSKKFDSFTIHPYRIIFYSNGLFLSAFSEKHNEVRTFAIERISLPMKTSKVFARPADANSVKIEPFGIHGGNSRTAVVWVKPEEKKRMKAKLIHGSQKFRFDRDGSMVISLEVSGKEDFFRWLLSQGSSVRLLEPADWVSEFQNTVKQIWIQYAP